MAGLLKPCLSCWDCTTITTWKWCCRGKPASLSSVLPTLKTGDVVLMRANKSGRFTGVSGLSASPWDHSGLIWVHDGVPFVVDSGGWRYFDFSRRPLSFDDNDPADDAWKQIPSGPQMYEFEKMLEYQEHSWITNARGSTSYYYEEIAVRPLKRPLSDTEMQKLAEAIKETRDVPYEKNKAELSNSLLDCCCCNNKISAESLNSLFCSELTALSLQGTGRLPANPPASEYTPSDYSIYHGCNCSAPCCCCLGFVVHCPSEIVHELCLPCACTNEISVTML
eukprot:m.343733 g.343733  ORF g.343733 m.343733 type:complete len:280 (+) comp20634_c2_seq24:472-1311(+)